MSGPSSGAAQPLVVRDLGRRDYQPVWQAMQAFTMGRGPDTADELWLLEHNPVFTLGQGGRREHLLDPGDIPVLQVDRGGQVTYHGPGQLVAYLLLDLRRARLGVKALVACLEEAVIGFLAQQGLSAERSPGAPGVYLAGAKIASLGLRVRQGCCYHGLALNLDLDLEPFNRINPCGYAGLRVTRLADWVSDLDPVAVRRGLVGILARTLALTPLELGVEADGRP